MKVSKVKINVTFELEKPLSGVEILGLETELIDNYQAEHIMVTQDKDTNKGGLDKRRNPPRRASRD